MGALPWRARSGWSGNPTATNLFAILRSVQKAVGVDLAVTVAR